MALQKAAASTMELEAMRTNPALQASSEDSALKASQLLERAFTEVYTRIQDQPGKDDVWKAEVIDRLETVRVH